MSIGEPSISSPSLALVRQALLLIISLLTSGRLLT